MQAVCVVFLYFISYSFIGWVCETIWCSVGSRHFVNRGFLNGPICPVYGFGALIVLYLLSPFTENFFTLFLAGIVLTSTLEYVTGWLMEKLFHLKLWDYSQRFCNINGRVCLRNSVLFGMMAVALVWGIHPFLAGLVDKFPPAAVYALSGAWAAVLFSDLAVTVHSALQLNGKLEELHEAMEELREKTEAGRMELQELVESKLEQQKARREELTASLAARKERFEQMLGQSRPFQRRLIRAFPNMTWEKHPEVLERFQKAIAARKK